MVDAVSQMTTTSEDAVQSSTTTRQQKWLQTTTTPKIEVDDDDTEMLTCRRHARGVVPRVKAADHNAIEVASYQQPNGQEVSIKSRVYKPGRFATCSGIRLGAMSW
jgi:hypothetical protein